MNCSPTTATDSLPVYQCPECLRQHDGAGAAVPFRVCVPELRGCGRADCAAVADQNNHLEQRRQERRPAGWKERQPAKDCRARRNPVLPGPSPVPPDRRVPYKDNDEDLRTPIIHQSTPPKIQSSLRNPDHTEEQHRFVAEGDGISDCEKMLEILFGSPDTGFRPDDPTRTSRGPWVSSHDLKYVHGIETPNSRASQLRGSATLEAHPLVKRFDLDIDCRRNPAEYSVCFKEHSERLRVG